MGNLWNKKMINVSFLFLSSCTLSRHKFGYQYNIYIGNSKSEDRKRKYLYDNCLLIVVRLCSNLFTLKFPNFFSLFLFEIFISWTLKLYLSFFSFYWGIIIDIPLVNQLIRATKQIEIHMQKASSFTCQTECNSI